MAQATLPAKPRLKLHIDGTVEVLTPPRTVSDFLVELQRSGKSLVEWARDEGLPITAVYQVTQRRLVGRRGIARQVVKAMGITPPPMFPNQP